MFIFFWYKMASTAGKENPPHNRMPRSKIPVVIPNGSGLTRKSRLGKSILLGDRQPLGCIQLTSTDGGNANGLNQPTRVRKPGQPFSSEVKLETRLTQVSPLGSVYKFFKSKTTKTVQKEENQKESLQDRLKNVTIRRGDDTPLDWNLEVFQNSGPRDLYEHGVKQTNLITDRSTVVSDKLGANRLVPKLLDHEREVAKNMGNEGTDLVPTRLYERRSKSVDRPIRLSKVTTPSIEPMVLHNRVKKIKRSLKRPSSRELQTRTSSEADIQQQVEIQTQNTLQTKKQPELLHGKILIVDIGSIDAAVEDIENIRNLTRPYERRIISYLMGISTELKSPPCIGEAQRAIVVNWLVKVNVVQGVLAGGDQVLQVAVRHLDRLLALAPVPVERVQLLAAACYWLAQKQCAKPRSATSFARQAANSFTPLDLRAAERYVLRKLNWPLIPVVANDFVPHLVQQCSPRRSEPLSSAAAFLSSAALLDADLCACAPDVLALAAVLNSAKLLQCAGKLSGMADSLLHRSHHSSSRLRLAMLQLSRVVLEMKDERCRWREPYVQFSKPPHSVAQRLVAAITAYKEKAQTQNSYSGARTQVV